jgi:hypothetical protein
MCSGNQDTQGHKQQSTYTERVVSQPSRTLQECDVRDAKS